MGHLLASFVAALAMAIATYDATASFLLAFVAYSVSGSLTLILATLADYYGSVDADQRY
ncbi:MAG: hypothetical protein AAFY06_08250 [Pseudomonadota bacterium]